MLVSIDISYYFMQNYTTDTHHSYVESRGMRTTVTLDESLVSELLKFTHAKSKTAAVAAALKEQIRRAKLEELASLLGTVHVEEKAFLRGDRSDLSRARWLDQIGGKRESG